MLALAAPLILTNLAQHGLALSDTILLGRLGAESLAAGALATSLYLVMFIACIGLTSAVSPLIADGIGQGLPDAVRRTVRAGVWAAGLVVVPMMVLLWHTQTILLALGQEPGVAAQAGAYMRALQWWMIPALLFMVLRNALAALERPGWPLAASLAALPLNLGLGLWFAFPGGLDLGLVGVAWGTTLTEFAVVSALLVVAARDPSLRRHRMLSGLWRFDPVRLARVFRLGLPMAATGLAEAGLFEAATVGMGLFGTVSLAAHAVAIQIAACCFMVPLGIGQAATVRVGLARGGGDRIALRCAGAVALALGFGFMSLCALMQVMLPRPLIGLFLDLDAPGNAEVLPIAIGFVGLAALFAMADGVQAVALGCLRGLQDTRVPMWIALFGYWGVGVPGGIVLAWGLGLRGSGIWLGFSAGLLVVAVLLVARWRRLSR